MDIYYRYYVIVQKDEKNLAIIECRLSTLDIIPILRHLNSVVIEDLTKQGLTDEEIAKQLAETVQGTDMAYCLGKGHSDKSEFNIFVQSEWIYEYDGEEMEAGDGESYCEGE